MDTNYTIRHMEEEDLIPLREVFSDVDMLKGTMRLPHPSAQSIADRLSHGEGMIRLVAEADGRFAGVVEMETYPSVPRHNHVGAIHLIATHPEFRGKGAGKALMEAAIEMADNWLNLRRLELSVWTPNDRAIALYKKCGFEVEGTLKDYVFRDGEFVDAYMMARMKA